MKESWLHTIKLNIVQLMNGTCTHRDPELLVCQALELGDGGLLEDGETQQDDQSHVQRTREPPALVCVVSPDLGHDCQNIISILLTIFSPR